MNVSDVKVWDAPSIGRNDGMSVETKCYQHVVIWADYAKALMKVENERDEANRVCEQWRQWTVAARADNEALRARVAELEADAERLNWLQANPRLSTIRLAGESDRECYMYAVAGAPGLKLREIIDAARLSGNKPPQCFSTEGDDRR